MALFKQGWKGQYTYSQNNLIKNISKIASATLIGSLLAMTGASQADVPKLSVSGSQIKANGQAVSFSGVSHFWSNTGWGSEKFYNASAVRGAKNFFGATIVRAAMGVEDGGGYLSEPNANRNRLEAVIDEAIRQDMYAIIDWHSHKAHNHQSEAIQFFGEMARKYGNKNHVIYEIYNEPLQISWSNNIKPYAEAVIREIRRHDPDNLIVVGTPQWSQLVEQAANDPISGTNIAYTLHFYAGTHTQWLRDEANRAMNKGIALFVTEWGTVNANGDGGVATAEANRWKNFMRDKKLSNLNWSLNDKSEGASVFKPGTSGNGSWNTNQLTASGNYVRDLVRSWPSSGSGSSTSSSSGSGFQGKVNLPGRIQAEKYASTSGETTSGNQNSGAITKCTYYGLGVDVQDANEGTCNVGWTAANERLNYKVGSAGGRFNIRVRHASISSGKRIQVRVNNTVVGQVTTQGGGWQTFKNSTISNVSIPSNATVSVIFRDGSTNLNYLDITRASGSSSSSSSSSSSNSSSSGSSGSCANVAYKAKAEINLNNNRCVKFSRNMNGRTLQVWDSDTNSSCDYRGTVSSANGSGSLNVNRNYVTASGFTGDTINFTTNGCKYVKVRMF